MENEEKAKKQKKPKSKARVITEWTLTIVFALIFVIFGIGQIQGMAQSKQHYGQVLRFGYGTYIVKTNSMEPEYKVDTAIVTYHKDVEKVYKDFNSGKTIDIEFFDTNQPKFQPDNEKFNNQTNVDSATRMPMCHRLREIHIDTSKEMGEGRYIFIASGINTQGNLSKEGQYQMFTEKEYLGVVVANNRVVGGIFNFMTTPWGYIVIICIPTFYIVITSVLDIFKEFKDTDETAPANGAGGGDAPKKNVSSLSDISSKDRERLKQQLLQEMIENKKKKQQEMEANKDEKER